MSSEERGTTAPALSLYYLLFYASIGITLPFLPQYLRSLGLNGTEVGLLLAVAPALSLIAPPLWGQLTDRSSHPGRILLIVTAATSAAFLLMLRLHSFGAVLTVLVLQACFSSAISTLIDSLTLRHIARAGGTYARIRLFGSIGFAVASLTFGRLIDVIDSRVLWAAFALTAGAATWAALGLTRVTLHALAGPKPSFASALGLAKTAEVRTFLIAVALHWIACGPYHSALSIHVTALKLPPQVVGDAATIGVLSEIAIMTTWSRWGHRIAPRHLLFISFAASAIRWAGVALTSNGTVLTLLGLFHGLTFGIFFLSSVAFMAERAPDSLRATGQALFVASAFGVGGVVGYLGTGIGLELTQSSHALFAIAAGLEVLPALLILRLPGIRPAGLRGTV